jgi:hypothetical protein
LAREYSIGRSPGGQGGLTAYQGVRSLSFMAAIIFVVGVAGRLRCQKSWKSA